MIGALVQVEGIEPTQHYATDLQSAPALQLWRTCIKRRCKHHKDEMHLLEGMTGIEPASSAWKADVLATIRHSHKEKNRKQDLRGCSVAPYKKIYYIMCFYLVKLIEKYFLIFFKTLIKQGKQISSPLNKNQKRGYL